MFIVNLIKEALGYRSFRKNDHDSVGKTNGQYWRAETRTIGITYIAQNGDTVIKQSIAV